jgi:Na+-transporting NADH:ubiquinone oxidoreductase subunit NqrB
MDEGFVRSVVRQQTVLFTLTPTVTAIWFAINILDIWSTTFDIVSERFDTIVDLRINAGLAALMVALSGLLWAHHRRKASYPTLLEFFFGVCFASFLFVLISSGVPAVFGG